MVHRPVMMTYYLLSDRVVGGLQVAQHLCHDLFGVAAVAHGIEQIHSPLANTHISLCLYGKQP